MSAPWKVRAVVPAPQDLWYWLPDSHQHVRALYVVVFSDGDGGPIGEDESTEVFMNAYDAAGQPIPVTEFPSVCYDRKGWQCMGHKDDPKYADKLEVIK